MSRSRGLELALGRDHLRAPLPLRLRLPRHRALHVAGDLDVLHLDDGDLDPPRRRRLVDDRLQDRVDLVALREQFVEHVLAEHRAQRRLRDLRGRGHVVLDLDDRRLRLHDPEVRDGVHTHGDVVLRDHLLRRDVQRHGTEVDLDHPVDDRDQQEEPGALRLRQQPAEPEHDRTLVLACDLHRREQDTITRTAMTATTISADVHSSVPSVVVIRSYGQDEVVPDRLDHDPFARNERGAVSRFARQSSPFSATRPPGAPRPPRRRAARHPSRRGSAGP